MQIFICDDELPILNNLTLKMQSLMPDETITSFSSAHKLLQALHQSICDVLFLDIDMPDLSGMDIAKQLNEMEHKPLLVFVTNHDELVYESLQYHPFGFIRKSFFDTEIEKVLADCKKELGSRDLRFHFRMANQDVVILLSNILYFEADGNYLNVYTTSENYRFRSTVIPLGKSYMETAKQQLLKSMRV